MNFNIIYPIKFGFSEYEVIRYCVDRIKTLVDDVSHKKVQLLSPNYLKEWLPDCLSTKQSSQNNLLQTIRFIKKEVAKMQNDAEKKKYEQLLDFIQEELLLKDVPRDFLIESAILSLKMCPSLKNLKELENLNITKI